MSPRGAPAQDDGSVVAPASLAGKHEPVSAPPVHRLAVALRSEGVAYRVARVRQQPALAVAQQERDAAEARRLNDELLDRVKNTLIERMARAQADGEATTTTDQLTPKGS